jgi:hypothetical protein
MLVPEPGYIGCTLRRIRFNEPETGKTFVFLSNQVTLPALTICALYKSRWQVELICSGTILSARADPGTLMFAISSCRRRKPFAFSFGVPFAMAAAEQSRRHVIETTVDHPLMRGLVTA